MKLLLCPRCQDVLKLQFETRYCDCGKSHGAYTGDGLTATFGGDSIALGFANDTLKTALQKHLLANPLPFPNAPGIRFTAFVIPEPCDTIIREK